MRVFVTVGTTRFDALLASILSKDVQQVLLRKGFDEMVIQSGKSIICPSDLQSCLVKIEEQFDYKPSLESCIQEADLVISHAGAGTCLEVLGAGKPLIVVINEELMGNHQAELANRLGQDDHLIPCVCSTLVETLQDYSAGTLKPFSAGNISAFSRHMSDKWL